MATYKNTNKIISHLNDEIEACGNPDSDNEPIAYGTKLGLLSAKAFIEIAETADVQEVRHEKCNMCNGKDVSLQDKFSGYWIDINTKRQELNIWHGDKCLANIHIDYCPNCGAKMDGDKAETKIKELEEKI